MPSDSTSNGLVVSLRETAGVLLKHIYAKIELSVSTPPVSIIFARPEVNSEIAIDNAPKELAQAASTTQFMPPRSKRLAILPDTTLANIPGKALGSHSI